MVKAIRLNYLSSSLTVFYSLKPLLVSPRGGDKKQKKVDKIWLQINILGVVQLLVLCFTRFHRGY